MYATLHKKVSPHQALYPALPSDIIIGNILPRLPVKSLIRFSTTSKTWYSVIKSPQFIASHLKFNTSQAKDPYLMIIDKTCRVLDSQTFVELMKFEFDLVPNVSRYLSLHAESCNGLFLLRMRDDSNRKYLLWNPSLRKSRELNIICDDIVSSKDGTSTYSLTFHGLGFNESCNDHRVVRVSYFLDSVTGRVSDVPAEVNVYSVSTNSWRRVQADPGRSICASKGMYLNGAFHWFARTVDFTSDQIEDHDFESILLFDFVDECFREMALPKDLDFLEGKLVEFREFEGSLGALSRIFDDGVRFYLWIMTEYGVTESWTHKFTIKHDMIDDWDYPYNRWLVGFTKRGEFIHFEWKECEKTADDVFLNIGYGKFWRRTEGKFQMVRAIDFTESLVLLGDGNYYLELVN